MHAAPPVRVSLGRDRAWITAVALLVAAAAMNVVAWLLAWAESSGAMVAVSVTAAGAIGGALGACLAWRAQPPGELGWDGAAWHWHAAAGEVEIALDLDRWMLLRFMPAARGARRWIAASRTSVPAQWSALRSALYSPRPADVPSPAQPTDD